MIMKPGIQEKLKMKLEHEELTENIIRAAIEVYQRLGVVDFLVSWFPDK